MKLIVFDLDNTVITTRSRFHEPEKLSEEQWSHRSQTTHEVITTSSQRAAATHRNGLFHWLCCTSAQPEAPPEKHATVVFLYLEAHLKLFYQAYLNPERFQLIFVTAGKYERVSFNKLLQSEIYYFLKLEQRPALNFPLYNLSELAKFGYYDDRDIAGVSSKAHSKALLLKHYCGQLPAGPHAIAFIDDLPGNRRAVINLFQNQCVTLDPTAPNYSSRLQQLQEEAMSGDESWPQTLSSDYREPQITRL